MTDTQRGPILLPQPLTFEVMTFSRPSSSSKCLIYVGDCDSMIANRVLQKLLPHSLLSSSYSECLYPSSSCAGSTQTLHRSKLLTHEMKIDVDNSKQSLGSAQTLHNWIKVFFLKTEWEFFLCFFLDDFPERRSHLTGPILLGSNSWKTRSDSSWTQLLNPDSCRMQPMSQIHTAEPDSF